MTIAEKQAELEAAGYSLIHDEDNWEVYADVDTPDGWHYSYRMQGGDSGDEIDQNLALVFQQAVEKAYAHLQQQKRMAALEALLRRLTALRINQLVEQAYGSDNLLTILELPEIQKEAKKLLADE